MKPSLMWALVWPNSNVNTTRGLCPRWDAQDVMATRWNMSIKRHSPPRGRYVHMVLRRPDVTPTLYEFGRHLEKVSRSYWPGLFHCYDVPGLPRTNNELESRFRDTGRRLLRTTGQKGLTQRTLQRQGAWELLPRPPTEA